ncbi:hypothetical protein [Mastigocoleus sp. MO_188.B34]|uniref:hypothetical protein n=1 Tax=Mastigocoleus sp. MO_188.B34 TaxID=3036635 RepID=UPI002622F029|nr:hypothetical protein [Mastigocoleus sp. MO_188.B34]MDJ0693239.1 hypothetical protein [Mastigocoleus sp. MO_188.B34]
MNKHQHTYLFRFVSHFIKFFLLALFGLTIAYVMSVVFDRSDWANTLFPIVFDWMRRLGIILLCLIAATMVVESLR